LVNVNDIEFLKAGQSFELLNTKIVLIPQILCRSASLLSYKLAHFLVDEQFRQGAVRVHVQAVFRTLQGAPSFKHKKFGSRIFWRPSSQETWTACAHTSRPP
jgi:hypothetical protein